MRNTEYIKDKYNWEDLKEIIELLRRPDGCPWDSTQTYESMRQCVLDEAEEVVCAIDNKDVQNLKEELGDLLLQVLLYSEIAKGRGDFTLEDVINETTKKIVRRHPDIFDDGTFNEKFAAAGLPEGVSKWDYIKMNEKKDRLDECRQLYEEGKITRELLELYEDKYKAFLAKIGVFNKKVQ